MRCLKAMRCYPSGLNEWERETPEDIQDTGAKAEYKFMLSNILHVTEYDKTTNKPIINTDTCLRRSMVDGK